MFEKQIVKIVRKNHNILLILKVLIKKRTIKNSEKIEANKNICK